MVGGVIYIVGGPCGHCSFILFPKLVCRNEKIGDR